MIEVNCSCCQKLIKRYLNKKRTNTILYCSRDCKSEHQKTLNVGRANPNYRGRDLKRICSCGQEKDHRAIACAFCSKTSSSKELVAIKTKAILAAVKEVKSMLELSKATGLSRQFISKIIHTKNIDVSHFSPCRERPKSIESLFVIGLKRTNGVIKSAIIKHKLLDYCCSKCYCNGMWMNEVITLELDHINGIAYDNRLENLRFLCPNCHSQTPTSRGRNSKGKKKMTKGNKCPKLKEQA